MNLHFHLLSQSNDSIHPTDTKWSLPLAVYPEASALPVKGTKPMVKFEERDVFVRPSVFIRLAPPRQSRQIRIFFLTKQGSSFELNTE